MAGKRKDAYYFSHDANAKSDSKCLRLRMKLGWEGYGLFWAIVEKLRESDAYRMLPEYDVIAYEFRTEEEKIKSVIEDFGLFEFDDEGYLFSQSLNRRMGGLDNKRQMRENRAKKAAKTRWEQKGGDNNEQTKYIQATQSNANTIPSNDKVMQGKVNAIPRDAQAIQSNANTIPSNDKVMQGKVNAIPRDAQAIQSNANTIPSNDKVMQGKVNAIPRDAQAIQSNANTIPSNDKVMQGKVNANPRDAQAIQSDASTILSDTNTIPSNPSTILSKALAMIDNAKAKPGNANAMLSDANVMLSDANVMLSDANAMLGDAIIKVKESKVKKSKVNDIKGYKITSKGGVGGKTPLSDASASDEEKDDGLDFKTDRIDYSAIANYWNKKTEGKLGAIRTLSKTRKKSIRARIKETSLEDFMLMIDNASNSSYMQGHSDSGWMATFDWCISPSKYPRVLEGQYVDKPVYNKAVDSSEKMNYRYLNPLKW